MLFNIAVGGSILFVVVCCVLWFLAAQDDYFGGLDEDMEYPDEEWGI